jgi:selenocysteine-specific elongation factor
LTASAPATSPTQVVLCLAGHIDHGKSSLVGALTGGIVDRLPEERRRGMTIELGFTHLDSGDLRFSFIDVPGHERFVHTMLAGASGVDLALLVIAADDSVMPQTREHLALLELLGIPRGVIALTKCDLVDGEQLELVRLEIAELVQGTFLADAPVIEVSARTGRGIDELRRTLDQTVRPLPSRATNDSRFRMPIDRVFSPSGQGTVVTGTVWRGTARVGDTLQLVPSGAAVRIRRLQAQGAEVEAIAAGQRAAINLAGIKSGEVRRGDELATPDTLEPSKRHLVRLRCLPDAVRGMKHRDFVKLHLGAGQTTAQVLMTQREVAPGEWGFAVVRCKSAIACEYGQPFVIRQLSPARTIGGGTVIAPALCPVDRFKRCLEAAPGLAAADPEQRLSAYIELRRETELDAAAAARMGLSRQQMERSIKDLTSRQAIVRTADPHPLYLTKARFQLLERRVISRYKTELEQRRPACQLPVAVLLSAMSHEASAPVVQAVLEKLVASGELVRHGDLVRTGAGADLSNRQRKLLETLLAECRESGATPPTLKEFAARQGCTLRELEPLVEVAVLEGRLERLSPDFAIEHAALERLRTSLAGYFQSHPSVTVSEIRGHWGITRKHAVPLFEYFDRRGITVRNTDVRTAGPRLHLQIGEVHE